MLETILELPSPPLILSFSSDIWQREQITEIRQSRTQSGLHRTDRRPAARPPWLDWRVKVYAVILFCWVYCNSFLNNLHHNAGRNPICSKQWQVSLNFISAIFHREHEHALQHWQRTQGTEGAQRRQIKTKCRKLRFFPAGNAFYPVLTLDWA